MNKINWLRKLDIVEKAIHTRKVQNLMAKYTFSVASVLSLDWKKKAETYELILSALDRDIEKIGIFSLELESLREMIIHNYNSILEG